MEKILGKVLHKRGETWMKMSDNLISNQENMS